MKAFDFLRYGAIILSVAVMIAGIVLLYPGAANFITGSTGRGTLEEIDFETLVLAGEGEEYLVCPVTFCRQAEPHEGPGIYAVPASRMRDILLNYVDSQPDVEIRKLDIINRQFEFIERSPNLRIPDLIAVQIIDLGENRSTLAIYARSFDGAVAPGHNESKIRRWLQVIAPGQS